MQIWDDAALSARLGETRPRTVAIASADPLARRALVASLGIAGLDDALVDDDGGPPPEAVDVVLYDDGPAPVERLVRRHAAAAEYDARWLALVASGARARQALGAGFTGALGRDATPEALAAAVAAVHQGLLVVDPRFASDVLPAAPATSAPPTLTPREHEVLELLAEGISNKEIAAQLGVSPHTAKFHVTALLDKLGAETRTEAVVLAARAGLLDL